MKIEEIINLELKSLVNSEKREILPRFFKTGKGQYGEGDKFLGVIVPNIRSVAKKHLDTTSIDDLSDLLGSPWHEMRMCGLLIMVEQLKCSKCKTWINKHSKEEGSRLRKQYFDFYLAHTDRINNWDLVDLSAPVIIGEYLLDKPREILYKLADSELLWNQRVAIVSTYTLIRHNDFTDIYALSEKLLHHKHDLMQKAIGWMLRETGKRNKPMLIAFLDLHAREMPRTMLRYSIEKFSEEERLYFMKIK